MTRATPICWRFWVQPVRDSYVAVYCAGTSFQQEHVILVSVKRVPTRAILARIPQTTHSNQSRSHNKRICYRLMCVAWHSRVADSKNRPSHLVLGQRDYWDSGILYNALHFVLIFNTVTAAGQSGCLTSVVVHCCNHITDVLCAHCVRLDARAPHASSTLLGRAIRTNIFSGFP